MNNYPQPKIIQQQQALLSSKRNINCGEKSLCPTFFSQPTRMYPTVHTLTKYVIYLISYHEKIKLNRRSLLMDKPFVLLHHLVKFLSVAAAYSVPSTLFLIFRPLRFGNHKFPCFGRCIQMPIRLAPGWIGAENTAYPIDRYHFRQFPLHKAKSFHCVSDIWEEKGT